MTLDLGDTLLSKNLLSMFGKKWHERRAVLSPAFTGSKMKGMFELMNACGEQYVQFLAKPSKSKNRSVIEVDLKETIRRYANDVIATSAFGIKINSFEDKDNEFYKLGQSFDQLSMWRILVVLLFPKIAKAGIPEYIHLQCYRSYDPGDRRKRINCNHRVRAS